MRKKKRAARPKTRQIKAREIYLLKSAMDLRAIDARGLARMTRMKLHNAQNILNGSNRCWKPFLRIEEAIGLPIVSKKAELFRRMRERAKTPFDENVAEARILVTELGLSLIELSAESGVNWKDLQAAMAGTAKPNTYATLLQSLRDILLRKLDALEEALRSPLLREALALGVTPTEMKTVLIRPGFKREGDRWVPIAGPEVAK